MRSVFLTLFLAVALMSAALAEEPAEQASQADILKVEKRLEGHGSLVRALAFNPAGRHALNRNIVMAGQDHEPAGGTHKAVQRAPLLFDRHVALSSMSRQPPSSL